MIAGTPNLAVANAGQPMIQFNPSPNVQAKASALTGEVLEVNQVQPVKTEALRDVAMAMQTTTRPEMVDKGSTFLSDPKWPPMDALNGIATLVIDDFFLNIEKT